MTIGGNITITGSNNLTFTGNTAPFSNDRTITQNGSGTFALAGLTSFLVRQITVAGTGSGTVAFGTAGTAITDTGYAFHLTNTGGATTAILGNMNQVPGDGANDRVSGGGIFLLSGENTFGNWSDSGFILELGSSTIGAITSGPLGTGTLTVDGAGMTIAAFGIPGR